MNEAYRVEEELWRGERYLLSRARTSSGRAVLLKTNRSLPAPVLISAALRREHDLLSGLRGPGIPRDIELVPDPAAEGADSPALVCGDSGFEPLRRLLQHGALSVTQFLNVARLLALALDALHEQGVVHRCLSLDAVLISEDHSQVLLIGFERASRLAESLATSRAPRTMQEILSPEQTGRINRRVDARCDLYALGAIYYQLLTKEPLFATSDPLELAHFHIAKHPRSPSELTRDVPEALSRIVLRLLRKMPEDRYQSARSLVTELDRFAELHARGEQHAFSLAPQGPGQRLAVSQRLYGRGPALDQLAAAFERARQGNSSVVFITGSGGVGKSALANELAAQVRLQGGRFLVGSFDAVERSIPYSALLAALRQLAQQAAEEPAERREALISRVRTLGSQRALLNAAVPQLTSLLETSAEVPATGPAETQNRFARAVQDLLRVVAQPEEPLVILLDNLQWADMATLRLLTSSLSESRQQPLLWLCTYRDDETPPDHPLVRWRMELTRIGVTSEQSQLSPLGADDLAQMLADSLYQSAATVQPLAELVHRKTDGNPFFVTQFLRELERNGSLRFDATAHDWHIDVSAIERAPATDNVAAWMTTKLGYLPSHTRVALSVASCVGARFSLSSVAMLRQNSLSACVAELWEAVVEGLLIADHPDAELLLATELPERGEVEFVFLHDRVQQAAYDLIPKPERASLHAELGRILLARGAAETERLFELVEHLNRARECLSAVERRTLAELNGKAARRARTSAAVLRAFELFQAGIELLDAQQDAELHATLSVDAAECEFICGSADSAEQRLAQVAASPVALTTRAQAQRVRVVRYENTGRFPDAVRVGCQALVELGFAIPTDTSERERALEIELATLERLLIARPISELAALPRLTDPIVQSAMQLMVATWPSAFLINERSLTGLLSALLVRWSLQRGNCEESALGYITHAITTNQRTANYSQGRAFGQLGLELSRRYDQPALRVKVEHLYGSFLAPWYGPLLEGQRHARTAHALALELGDFTYGARAAFLGTWYPFFQGQDLQRFETEALEVARFLTQVRHEMIERAERLLIQWSRNLQGRTFGPLSLTDESCDEASLEQAFARVPIFSGFLNVARLSLALDAGEFERAWDFAELARERLSGSAETIWHHELDFQRGVCAVARAEKLANWQEEVAHSLAAIEPRARSCPRNFSYQQELLQALVAAKRGNVTEANSHFERAVLAADSAQSARARALTHEAYGKFWHSQGDLAQARAELGLSRLACAEYKAHRKLNQLEQLEAELTSSELRSENSSLDVWSALKATQAIAAELEWERLLPRLIQILIENTGAERGVLLEADTNGLQLIVEGNVDTGARIAEPPVPLAAADLPWALVQHVHDTAVMELLSDARKRPELLGAEYTQRRSPRSVLCVPVRWQNTARGVLYLENSLACDVFSRERLQAVSVLGVQAAVSLENARLYREMKREVARRSVAEAALQHALSDLESLKDKLQAENVYLQEELQAHHNFEEIIGRAPELLEALRKVERVATTDSTVLIFGETGTGKELFARAIHSRSARRERPLVAINCGAIATGLVESELFGHVKGAFTGALQKRVGRFELADGGTLFLDEIGELPLDTQAKLLRVLQEQEFEPVGSSRTLKVDVRVIAATNRDLEKATRAGAFRADLLYRLNVFPIQVPPLRQRARDIPLLVAFFVARLSKRLGKPLEGFSRPDMQALMEYAWPGNVRELQNVVERAAILAKGTLLGLEGASLDPKRAPAEATQAPASARRAGSIEDVERAHILSVLEATSWVVEGARGAAGILGLHPNTLRSRMKRLGIARPVG